MTRFARGRKCGKVFAGNKTFGNAVAAPGSEASKPNVAKPPPKRAIASRREMDIGWLISIHELRFVAGEQGLGVFGPGFFVGLAAGEEAICHREFLRGRGRWKRMA